MLLCRRKCVPEVLDADICNGDHIESHQVRIRFGAPHVVTGRAAQRDELIGVHVPFRRIEFARRARFHFDEYQSIPVFSRFARDEIDLPAPLGRSPVSGDDQQAQTTKVAMSQIFAASA